jgi:excisionase family DNA binding protein
MSMRPRRARTKATPSVLPERKRMDEQTGTVYTPEQIAERWGVARWTVLKYLRTGKLKGFKVGRSWRIRARDLSTFIQEGTLVRKQRPWS